MKFVGFGACVAVLVAVCASSAWAADYYVSGALGGVFREPYATTAPLVRERTNFDPGIEADVAVGRRFSLGAQGALRAEAEFSFRDYQVGTTTVTPLGGPAAMLGSDSIKTTSGLHQQRYAETANLFYDFTQFKGFTPYVGAGLGYQEGVQTSGQRVRTDSSGAVTILHSGSSSSDDGTWLAEAGVAVPLTKRLSLAPAYRFSQAFAGDKPIHLMRVALRYSF